MRNKTSILFFVGVLILALLIFGGLACKKETTPKEEAKEVPGETEETKEELEKVEEKEEAKEEEEAEEEKIEEEKEEAVEDIKVGSVEHKFEDLEAMQKSVDEGHQPWRLDPYMVALSDGVALGFDQEKDTFTLVSKVEIGEYSGTGEATVEAIHNGVTYVIQLIQPVKQGTGGIWVINSVRKK